MPIINGKKFAYTKKGISKAIAAAKAKKPINWRKSIDEQFANYRLFDDPIIAEATKSIKNIKIDTGLRSGRKKQSISEKLKRIVKALKSKKIN